MFIGFNAIQSMTLSNDILYIVPIIFGLIFLSTGFFGCSGAITQIQCLLICVSICRCLKASYRFLYRSFSIF